MVDEKISDYTALLATALADDDYVEFVDKSDTTMSALGTNKQVTLAELRKFLATRFLGAGYTTGRYYTGLGNRGSNTALTASLLYYRPFPVVVTSQTFDRISASIATAGSGGTPVLRMGIFNDVGGLPSGAPLLDAGTVAATATGVAEITISQALARGWYWLGIAAQGATTTQPTLISFATAGSTAAGTTAQAPGTSDITAAKSVDALTQASVTGALPTVGTLTDLVSNCPMVWMRAA